MKGNYIVLSYIEDI